MNAVITGASKGIGLAIAQQLVALEYNLIINSRNQQELDQVAQDLQSLHAQVKIYPFAADLSTKEGCTNLIQFCLQTFSVIDVLVNNAGYFLPGHIASEPEGLLDQMLNINLLSAYHVSRGLIPSFKAQKRGTIINIGSVAGLQAYREGGSYSISKFALIGFSKNLREELKPYGIKVSTINPGATLSNSWAGSDIDPNRIMEAQDIAKVVASICSLSPQAVLEEVTLRPLLGDL